MIQLGLPWALALLPLPFLVWRFAPPHRKRVEGLRFPFFREITRAAGADARPGAVVLSRSRLQMAAAILDDNGGFERFAEANEIGVIAISGPNVFAGYVSDVHNQGIWFDVDGRRWLNTGDLGRQDADGYFWLTGRKKEMINVSGFNVYPNESCFREKLSFSQG